MNYPNFQNWGGNKTTKASALLFEKKSRPALLSWATWLLVQNSLSDIRGNSSLSFQYIISLRECAGEEEAKTQNSPSRCASAPAVLM